MFTVNLDVKLADFLSKAGHLVVVVRNLVPQALVQPLHVGELVSLGHLSVFHIAHLLPQPGIVCFMVPQPVHLDLQGVQLARPLVAVFLCGGDVLQLLPQTLVVRLQVPGSLLCRKCSIVGLLAVAFGQLHNLLVVTSFLGGLLLESAPLLSELALKSRLLLSDSLCDPLLQVLAQGLRLLRPLTPPEILFMGESFVLGVHAALHLLLQRLLSVDRLHLHPALLLLEPVLEVPFLLHDLFAVA